MQSAVLKRARELGWRATHFSNSMAASGRWMTVAQADGAGFPDLVCVRGNRLLFAELKAQYRKPSPAQIEWAQALVRVAEMYLWYPKDWQDGSIEEVLKGDDSD